jgi:hypothetical protein
VRFLLVRKRASCGYDNTAQRHFRGRRHRSGDEPGRGKTAQVEISLDIEVSWR